jgi:ABC-type multidrug transport system fused ATPase/permease subunit
MKTKNYVLSSLIVGFCFSFLFNLALYLFVVLSTLASRYINLALLFLVIFPIFSTVVYFFQAKKRVNNFLERKTKKIFNIVE